MKENSKIKIVVVDDHTMFRQGLIFMLSSLDGFEIIGEAGNGNELLALLKKVKPDIILMDVKMPGLGGIETTELVKSRYSKIKVIALTMFDEKVYMAQMIRKGANAYLFKSSPIEQLEKTIRNVYLNGSYFEEEFQGLLQENNYPKTVHRTGPGLDYSRKELEIMTLLSKGLSSKEIADILELSSRTIEGYRSTLLKKTGTKTIAELISYAKDNELIV